LKDKEKEFLEPQKTIKNSINQKQEHIKNQKNNPIKINRKSKEEKKDNLREAAVEEEIDISKDDMRKKYYTYTYNLNFCLLLSLIIKLTKIYFIN
jgi:hypothetical protein